MAKKKKLVNVAGKRKKAIARATLKEGTGEIKINNIPLELYEPRYGRMKIKNSLGVAREHVDLDKIKITITTTGGGVLGQSDAIACSIARGLCKYSGSEELLQAYHAFDRTLIAGDHRLTEPHKPGQSSQGPRHKRQKSYR